jgi:ATP-dependent DNA helicase PIF1
MLTDSELYDELDFHNDFARTFDAMENTDRNIFVTGKAGTGKSTLLQYFRKHTTKNIAILASTGVAAVHIKGQTIHSFFRFRPDISLEKVPKVFLNRGQRKIFEALDTIVIDEVSMVRADLLDCIELFLRIYGPDPDRPFGGVQLIFFGDLYQLPPVVTPYERESFRMMYNGPFFFHARSFPELRLSIFELTQVYRQKQQDFVELLGSVRDNTINQQGIEWLNQRHIRLSEVDDPSFYIYLTTTNRIADQVNLRKLEQLSTPEVTMAGTLTGHFKDKQLPTTQELMIKINAQVMLLNNDSEGRWINGSIGRVTDIVETSRGVDHIQVELMTGETVAVKPFTWEMFHYKFNEDTEALEQEKVGSFKQFPIRLAWAVTIHKSQGQTFDRVVLDIGSGTFAPGQVYVALSRCTTIEGLVLKQRLAKRHIIVDRQVVDFMTTYNAADEAI